MKKRNWTQTGESDWGKKHRSVAKQRRRRRTDREKIAGTFKGRGGGRRKLNGKNITTKKRKVPLYG